MSLTFVVAAIISRSQMKYSFLFPSFLFLYPHVFANCTTLNSVSSGMFHQLYSFFLKILLSCVFLPRPQVYIPPLMIPQITILSSSHSLKLLGRRACICYSHSSEFLSIWIWSRISFFLLKMTGTFFALKQNTSFSLVIDSFWLMIFLSFLNIFLLGLLYLCPNFFSDPCHHFLSFAFPISLP